MPVHENGVLGLLANGDVVEIDVEKCVVQAQYRSRQQIRIRDPGHYVGVDAARGWAYVLIDDPHGQFIVSLSLAGNRDVVWHQLPHDGYEYSSLAVGARSGDVYVFGNDSSGLAITAFEGAPAKTVLTRWEVPLEPRRDWRVMEGETDAKEQTIYVSYHGSRSTGIDWLRINHHALTKCSRMQRSGTACLPTHGAFSILDGVLLAATGITQIALADTTAGVLRYFDTALHGNHLMEFAVSDSGHRLYAAGSCLYSGGLSVLTLDSVQGQRVSWTTSPGHVATVSRDSANSICGDRIALLPDRELLVLGGHSRALNTLGVLVPGGQISTIDLRTFRGRQCVNTSADVVDIMKL